MVRKRGLKDRRCIRFPTGGTIKYDNKERGHENQLIALVYEVCFVYLFDPKNVHYPAPAN